MLPENRFGEPWLFDNDDGDMDPRFFLTDKLPEGIFGRAYGEIILLNAGEIDSMRWMVNALAHELQHARFGAIDNFFRMLIPGQHQNIYDEA